MNAQRTGSNERKTDARPRYDPSASCRPPYTNIALVRIPMRAWVNRTRLVRGVDRPRGSKAWTTQMPNERGTMTDKRDTRPRYGPARERMPRIPSRLGSSANLTTNDEYWEQSLANEPLQDVGSVRRRSRHRSRHATCNLDPTRCWIMDFGRRLWNRRNKYSTLKRHSNRYRTRAMLGSSYY